ncbi:MAG: SEC-C domain-containing protein [Proteobacteria bacterium]|nr:SEC-C domain-containing protein [Pseudomonadota bacterium]
MAKIGRNDKCPCRSGKKYKHCCAQKEQENIQQQSVNVTLMSGVKEIQADAENKKNLCRELGVFFFFSTAVGDAWLLEMTECDCVQVARNGVALEAPIDENSEVIEINYSHTFALDNKQLVITAYADKNTQILTDAPTRELSAAIRRIRKKFSGDQLQKVHLPNSENLATT